MKRLYLFAISLFIVTATFAQNRGFKPISVPDATNGNLYEYSYALVIGESDYTNGWQRLNGVKTDVPEVKRALEAQGFYVVVKENIKSEDFNRTVKAFIANYGQNVNSRIIIYYAGHGHTVKNQLTGKSMGYVVPVDAPNPAYDKSGFLIKAVDMNQFNNYALQIQSKHALFMFDACFAGTIFSGRAGVPPAIDYKTAQPVRQFITSGDESEVVADASIFRREFVNALTSPIADANKDGFLTASELSLYLYTQVSNNSNGTQHPVFGKLKNTAYNKGDFVFVLSKQTNTNIKNTVVNTTIEEKNIAPLITYGNLQINNYLQGKLFIDGSYKQIANKNKRISINDLPSGTHTIKIVADNDTWQEQVIINQNQTATLTAKSTYLPPVADYTAGAAGTTYTNNKAGITMVWAGGGTFQMGSNGSDAWDFEKPVHTVTVGNFSLSQTEITNIQYCKFLNEKGNQTEGGYTWLGIYEDDCQIEKRSGIFYPKSGYDNYPVIEVTWYGAKAYCEWVGGRLPTEAEWQFAAKAGSSYKYAGSNNIDEVAWYSGNAGGKTHLVAQKKANAFGLYDMSGNVWEWVEDKWHDNYNGAPTDGSAWTNGSSLYLVSCGGSWYYPARISRSSVRGSITSNYNSNRIGFRVAHSL